MGAKITPTPNNSGRTVLGVRIGCQAFKRCWRKAVSIILHDQPLRVPMFMCPCAIVRAQIADVLGGLRLFCFLSGSSCSRILLESACSMVCDMFVCEDCTPVERGGRWSQLQSSFPSVAFVSGGREAAKARYSASSLQGSHQGLQQQQSSARGGATPVLRMFYPIQAQARRSTSTGVLQTMLTMRIIRHKITKHMERGVRLHPNESCVRKGLRIASCAAVQPSRAILFAYITARSDVQCTFKHGVTSYDDICTTVL
jgi:hypothetical protein